jgi:serine/threonine-protein kinase
MAELFLGMSRGAEGFEKPVAIKRILPHLARDVDIARMFLAEAKLATHLHHQNIATVHDVGSSPEGLFLVMELVNGWDLGMLQRHAARLGRRFPPPTSWPSSAPRRSRASSTPTAACTAAAP